MFPKLFKTRTAPRLILDLIHCFHARLELQLARYRKCRLDNFSSSKEGSKKGSDGDNTQPDIISTLTGTNTDMTG